jgi:hypothetical protein
MIFREETFVRNRQQKRKPKKFTGGAKVTLTALSLLGFFGSWNAIGRMENPEILVTQPPENPNPGPALTLSISTPTPWPTLAPLADIPPIPTLQSNQMTPAGSWQSATTDIAAKIVSAPPGLEPLPTFAPLPPMPSIPEPQPLPQFNPASGWQQSGAS